MPSLALCGLQLLSISFEFYYMRLFIASGFSAPTRERVTGLQDFAKPLLGDPVRWVKPRNLHLTYAFLGAGVLESRLPAIRKSLDEAAGAFRKAFVTLGGFGAFPSLECPRVLWLGVREGSDVLKAMALKLYAGLSAEGFILERGFSAHITIARVNPALLTRDEKTRALPDAGGKCSSCGQKSGVRARQDRSLLKRVTEKAEELNVRDIIASLDLMESTLTAAGPEYRVRYSKTLL